MMLAVNIVAEVRLVLFDLAFTLTIYVNSCYKISIEHVINIS